MTRPGVKPRPALDRIMERVVASDTPFMGQPCWIYTGSRDNGYGRLSVGSTTDDTFRREYAHRITYTHTFGAIPEGMHIDHLCRVRSCCNPAHLEVVTQRENLARGLGIGARNAAKTHCPQGHEYTPDNTILARVKSGTGRRCRECQLRLQRLASRRVSTRRRIARRLAAKYEVARTATLQRQTTDAESAGTTHKETAQ